MKFELTSTYKPTGDQPQAIEKLIQGLKRGNKHQTLLGVTGSGKTFTVANVINRIQKPTLVISHNKTLAAQLYQEFREFFPKNAVSYFVSYYDYYQPEAYLPSTDTYIEKETEVNEEIDKLRLAATTALATRHDVIIVASVSAIYNLGSPSEYQEARLSLEIDQKWPRRDLLVAFAKPQYERHDTDFGRGTYRVRGESIEILPAYENNALRLAFAQDFLKKIEIIHPISGQIVEKLDQAVIYPAKHYIASEKTAEIAIELIKKELEERLKFFQKANKQLEAHRLKARTNYDIEMIQTLGYCTGIENYSRHFDGRKPGEPPFVLLDYFPKEFMLIVDESHQTIPQAHGMYNGDRSRKQNLVDFGFRLPCAYDNRPLTFEEFERRFSHVLFVSATPGPYELRRSGQVVELMRQLRAGEFDVLVGINLLREGLDIPEVSLVAILDADKEGFLRNETSIVQTIGRAARHPEGRAILYADKITGSIKSAVFETERRRKIQEEHNR